MAKFPKLPLYTDALLGDTQHLSAEQFGAYVLMLIVAWRSPGCSLPDNDRQLQTLTRLTVHRWKQSKDVLLAFWTLENGRWIQKRLTREFEKIFQFIEQKRSAGKISSALRNNKTGSTDVALALQRGVNGGIDSQIPKKEDERVLPSSTTDSNQIVPSLEHTSSRARAKLRADTGTRLDPDWMPSEENQKRTIGLGLNLDQSITEFRNYWLALPGSKGRKLDWQRTYHNRILELAARHHKNGVSNGGQFRNGWAQLNSELRARGGKLWDEQDSEEIEGRNPQLALPPGNVDSGK